MKRKEIIFTIGHSTMALEKFIAVLKENSIALVADIRTIPRSRHNPQFNMDTLPAELAKAGIEYIHLGALGGLRHTRPDSINTAWINASFRGFADYMQTREFEKGLRELIKLAGSRRKVIMCAEAVPWRCHRALISDALTARGYDVEHITGAGRPHLRRFTSFAHVEGRKVTYPQPGTGAK